MIGLLYILTNSLVVLSLRQIESKSKKKKKERERFAFSMKKGLAVNEWGHFEQSNSQYFAKNLKNISQQKVQSCHQISALDLRFIFVSGRLKKNILDHHNTITIDRFFSKTKTGINLSYFQLKRIRSLQTFPRNAYDRTCTRSPTPRWNQVNNIWYTRGTVDCACKSCNINIELV